MVLSTTKYSSQKWPSKEKTQTFLRVPNRFLTQILLDKGLWVLGFPVSYQSTSFSTYGKAIYASSEPFS